MRRVEAYRTVARSTPTRGFLARVAAADAVSFTATSSVAAFVRVAHRRRSAAAAPTARRLHRADHRHGGPVGRPAGVHEAWGSSAEGIVAELVDHFGPGPGGAS